MKGIILAGGSGTRLLPMTKVTNKHLLPVYNKPMIYYPLETLVKCGVKDIMLVSGRGHAGHFLELLRSGEEFGVSLSYGVQEEAGGIAHALALCENFADKDRVVVMLGDNIFQDHRQIKKAVKEFENQKRGAKIILKEVEDARRFGVASMKKEKITKIVEKPKTPETNLAVTGCYLYDKQVWQVIQKLKPSGRGELEITDVNNFYVKQGSMTFEVLKGWWTDAGTVPSLLRAGNLIAKELGEGQ